MNQNQLLRYSFLWSEARLIIAAVALLIGGTPPILKIGGFMPFLFGLAYALLRLSWLVSGAASIYLGYLWFSGDKKLFGGKETLDTIAFLVSIVSGINLGLVGVTGNNIGMSIVYNYPIFIITALIYLASAYHLYSRWKASGERVF